jgi:hypothetical protein
VCEGDACGAVEGVADVLVGVAGGAVVGWLVGDDGAWVGEGDEDGDGDAVACAFGATPGGAWLLPPCQDNATYPLGGTFSDRTPAEEYFQVPDVPSDHHSDQ